MRSSKSPSSNPSLSRGLPPSSPPVVIKCGFIPVFKGRKMPGRMGGKQRIVKDVWVYKIDPARNLMWVRGQNEIMSKPELFVDPDLELSLAFLDQKEAWDIQGYNLARHFGPDSVQNSSVLTGCQTNSMLLDDWDLMGHLGRCLKGHSDERPIDKELHLGHPGGRPLCREFNISKIC
ncbi:hypothetical protein HYC85_001987 [Camellia sinensis]|uniref:Uncharacterized protein n=1 Tax=Camellia sinensis TaxID=4442 RepID=A0A7J7I9C3_CAMSI|nr:hypothetical protein HYC85_001987 [Camellia sinensis]